MMLTPSPRQRQRASTLVISVFIIALLAMFIGTAFDYTRGTAYVARRGRDMTAAQALADGALEAAFKKWQVYMAANQSNVFGTASSGTFASAADFKTKIGDPTAALLARPRPAERAALPLPAAAPVAVRAPARSCRRRPPAPVRIYPSDLPERKAGDADVVRAGNDALDLDVHQRVRRFSPEGHVQGGAKFSMRDLPGEMNEVFSDGRTVDRQQTAGGGIDLQHVVMTVDDHHALRQVGHQLGELPRSRLLAVRFPLGGLHCRLSPAAPASTRPQRRYRQPLTSSLIELELGIHRNEVLRRRAHRLSLSEDQVAGIPQREGEELQGMTLQLGVEVDEHIPAEDQVDARERGALGQVVLAEDGDRSHSFLDMEASSIGVKWRSMVAGERRASAVAG